MTMILIRPTSILQLTLTGFLVVILPLMGALVFALLNVGTLSELSREAVSKSSHIMQSSRALTDQITTMERHARQYQILGDPRIMELYGEGRQQFLQTVADLNDTDSDPASQDLLQRLASTERDQHVQLLRLEPGSEDANDILEEFSILSGLTRQILTASSESVEQIVSRLQTRAAEMQTTLIWQAIVLLSVTLLLSLLFSFLITKPLHNIDLAIRSLGSGDFTRRISIRGPLDMENLGRRIEWLRNRLTELEEQKVNVLRQISHDLKTPLTSIREGAGLLSDGLLGALSSEQAEVTEILRDNSILLQNRIEDLINFSVARTPNADERVAKIRLTSLIEQVIGEHRISIKAKEIHLRSSLAPVRISGNPEQLRVILGNLISNAVKFSPKGGEISISLQRQDEQAIIDVRDNGPGIDPEDRTRIFEAFYQGASPHPGYVKGTGLGLAIAQEFARLHHGSIAAVECAHGAHLQLRLPLMGT